MILGTTVFLSTLIVLFNLLSDILAAWMNPRLQTPVRRQGMNTDVITDIAQAEQGTSLWKDAWLRLRKNHLALYSAWWCW